MPYDITLTYRCTAAIIQRESMRVETFILFFRIRNVVLKNELGNNWNAICNIFSNSERKCNLHRGENLCCSMLPHLASGAEAENYKERATTRKKEIE